MLGPDPIHPFVGAQDPAVVLHVSRPDAEAEIDEHVLAHWVGYYLGQHLPAVQLRVGLEMVVQAAWIRGPDIREFLA